MKCFVIMPISDAEGYSIGHFNRVYQYLLRAAIEKAGFEKQYFEDELVG